eukprot:TRINITY_DN7429_c0_g1_i1.p1 TRINITY_DN7429_c0_g1~~TRINITY_DN7429_c0_g1_i1.p1  ORF type:complete len:482 (+),score=125.91 TRINITY_DN7429_c0_g1_i1:38-1447(+)
MSREDGLMVSISGVRGIIGESLLPSTVTRFVTGYANYLILNNPNPGESIKVVLGRDSRVSGPWVVKLVEAVLQGMGIDVLFTGIVPTPTVQYMVIKNGCNGGIIVTSSHNPIEWNGLKFVDADGLFMSPDSCKVFYGYADDMNNIQYPSYQQMGTVTQYENAIQEHVDAVLNLEHVDVSISTERKFKVCLDTVNGAGGPIMKSLLEQLGCEVIAINYETTGVFSHSPEPIPENLGQLCDAVVENGADFGIATDPDVDRCVFIDERGIPFGEEYTLGMAVLFWLKYAGKRGPICKNLSSSRLVDDIAENYECEVIATPVGEIHVAKKMVEVGAVIGGEGNGGVMLPDIHIGRDAPVAAALAIQLIARLQGTLSEIKSEHLPEWEIAKTKISVAGVDDLDAILEKIKAEYIQKGAKISTEDGLRIDTASWWVHLRKSNTEPVIRVISEAETMEKATQICEIFLPMFEEHQQ